MATKKNKKTNSKDFTLGSVYNAGIRFNKENVISISLNTETKEAVITLTNEKEKTAISKTVSFTEEETTEEKTEK